MRKWKPPTIPKRCDAVTRAIKTLHESKRRAASGRNNKSASGNTQQTNLERLIPDLVQDQLENAQH